MAARSNRPLRAGPQARHQVLHAGRHLAVLSRRDMAPPKRGRCLHSAKLTRRSQHARRAAHASARRAPARIGS
jgi:hypothetical protein